ncbi:MAG: SDR family oxidoreductase [Salipiger thiooxidans]|uniref:SDR family oxidoreductase n=1 Tax=Salipiger thiooxidans TaxID=282683 RepID=UPI001CF9E4A2|nr:SDR family oxidoreductase [Salipiger thiooxidans]
MNAIPGRLQDKVAIAPGAAIARSFAAEGARVVVAERNPETGQAVADETGGLFVRTDVTDQAQVEAVAAATLERFGRIDVQFNADLTIAR